MLGIRKGSVDLDLALGSKILIEWIATTMNDSSDLLGGYSYPFILPFTDKNNSELGHANQLENRTARHEEVVTITAWGRPWRRVKMQYNLTDAGYDCDCQIDHGELANLIRDKALNEIFVTYKNGIFEDLKWLTIGVGALEARTNIVDSCINPGKYPWVFFPIRNEAKFGGADPTDQNFAESNYINSWAGGQFINIAGELGRKKYYYSPQFYLTWAIKECCKYLGFEAVGDIFTDPDMLEKVIYNTGCIDTETFFHIDGLKIAPARHLPKIKISDFIKALRNPPLNMSIYFDGDTRKAYFNLKESLLTSPAVDISKYVDPEKVRVTRNGVSLYELKTKIDSSDALFEYHPFTSAYFIGSGIAPVPIPMGVGTTYMKRTTNNDAIDNPMWRTPWALQICNVYSDRAVSSGAYHDPETPQDISKNEFEFRILHYKGMVPDSVGDLYPYATSDSKNQLEVEEYLNSCLPGGQNGLLNKYCREWFAFMLTTEKHEFTCKIPFIVLQNISPLKMISFRSKTKVLLPSVFDKTAFEEGALRNRSLTCKFSVYPHFNMSAIISTKTSEFVIGEPSGQVPIFAKLVRANFSAELGPIASLKRDHWADVVVEFYSDEAGTIPLSVTQQKVAIIERFRGLSARNYRDTPLEFICDGTSSTLIVHKHIYHYKYRSLGTDELERYAYDLNPSITNLGYQIIPNEWEW